MGRIIHSLMERDSQYDLLWNPIKTFYVIQSKACQDCLYDGMQFNGGNQCCSICCPSRFANTKSLGMYPDLLAISYIFLDVSQPKPC